MGTPWRVGFWCQGHGVSWTGGEAVISWNWKLVAMREQHFSGTNRNTDRKGLRRQCWHMYGTSRVQHFYRKWFHQRHCKWPRRTKQLLSKPVLNKAYLFLKCHFSLLAFYQGKFIVGILRIKWKHSFLLPCNVLNPKVLFMNSFLPLDTPEIPSIFSCDFVQILNTWLKN